MVNLDSSWQASVIKLAQAGNSRAIAFWLNRELVPQGVCAQIAAESSGCLAIQIVSRQTPDCDKLVRYICQQLSKLDSEAIQQVRITAQMVGASELLWEKSARILPPSARQAQSAAQTAVQTATQTVAPPQIRRIPVQATLPLAAVGLLEPVLMPAPDAEQAAQPKSVAGAGTKANSLLAKGTKSNSLLAKLGLSQFRPKGKSGRSVHSSAHNQAAGGKPPSDNLQSKIQTLKLSSIAAADRSIRWFVAQTPASRTLILGGSAVTAFLIGCSFELAGYYVNPAAFQRSKATLGGFFHSALPSGSVQTVSERIPIIRQSVLNPDDPAISLIFSNSDLLTRLPANQRMPDQVNPNAPLVALEAYRQADMLVTNLNHSVISAAASASPLAKAPQADQSSPIASPDESPQLTGLPAEADATAGDHESEKMDFIANDKAAADQAAEAPAESDKKQIPLTPQELVTNRVNLVNLASSAVMPDGQAQLSRALNLLKQGNIYAVGAGQNLPEARRPQIFEVKGKRIAYLGYSDSSPRAASGITSGINVSVTRQMQEDIQAIRDQVDWVVVSFNWNRELRAYPEDWQINLAHAAVDDGADLVVGYHPTAMQGGEIYNGRAIVYSLGNAIDEYSEQPTGSYQAAALKVTLKDQMMQLEFLPLQVKGGQAQAAQGESATKILQYLQQASSLFDQPLRSPTSLNSQVRLSLPAAPNSEMPADPFIRYPAPEASPTQP